MLLPRVRRCAPLALLAALHVAFFSVAFGLAPAGWAQAQAPAQPPQDLISRGKALFDDQQYEESIQTLSAALLRPNNTAGQKVEIYRYLALDYITLGRKDEAESAVRGLLALQPDYALAATESPRFRDFFADVRQRWEAEGRPGLVKEAQAPPPPITMRHTSPSQVAPNTQVDLTAHLDDPSHRVQTVKVFYRGGSHGKFAGAEALLDGGTVRASIPPESVHPPLVEYYLQGFDKGGLPVVSRGDASLPMRIVVPEPSRGWILPVAIGGGVLAAAAIVVGGLFLGGAFHKSAGPGAAGTTMPPPMPSSTSQVTIVVGP